MALFDETFAPYYPLGSRTLSSGKSGTDVAIVQSVYNGMLSAMNPSGGPIGSPIHITGKYDASTVLAVKNIQSYFGLSVDGVCGPNTYFVFGQGVGAHTTYGGPVFGSRQLSEGMSGGDVTILQNRLNCYRYAATLLGPASGVFRAPTSAAVLAFKKDAEANGDTGFPNNAIVGYGTYDALWLYTLAGGRAIDTGRNGFDVVFVQGVLLGLGYYTGRITGYYDAPTRQAVVAFQTAQRITADGVVGPATFYHLGKNNNNAAPSPFEVFWPPSVMPQVTVCSTPLTTTTGDSHPYGEASLVLNVSEGFESLDVVGNFLNPPGQYGNYDAYVFVYTDNVTGEVYETITMTQTTSESNPGDWAGTYSPGVKTIPEGVVSIYPINTTTGNMGELILAGTLQNCQ